MENPGITAEKREEAAKTLREILDRMGIEAEVSAFDDGERIILDAHGAESGLIIGKKGATLDALQYVINRIISKKPSDGPGVVVDAEGYRGRREDSLADLARRLAEKAIKSGRPVPVEPMSPHDRRIVHVTLKEHPDVTTESEGEGAFRRVVIFPKKAASAVDVRRLAESSRRRPSPEAGADARRPPDRRRRRASACRGAGRRPAGGRPVSGGDQLDVAVFVRRRSRARCG